MPTFFLKSLSSHDTEINLKAHSLSGLDCLPISHERGEDCSIQLALPEK